MIKLTGQNIGYGILSKEFISPEFTYTVNTSITGNYYSKTIQHNLGVLPKIYELQAKLNGNWVKMINTTNLYNPSLGHVACFHRFYDITTTELKISAGYTGFSSPATGRIACYG